MRTIALLVGFGLVATCVGDSRADLTLLPNAASNVIGNTVTAAPGFGAGSWQANTTTAGDKSELYIDATALFGKSITIGDIASVSYWTNTPGTESAGDWTFYMYTAPTGTNDSAGAWYHSRLNSEPYLTGASVSSKHLEPVVDE